MKKLLLLLIATFLFLFTNCTDEDYSEPSDSMDGLGYALSGSSGSSGSSSGGSVNSPGTDSSNVSGLITAGEWNDLENWSFWKNILNEQDYSEFPEYWDFYTNNRISVLVKDMYGQPLIDQKVVLKQDNNIVWESRTDNFGKAELWISLFQKQNTADLTAYKLFVEDQPVTSELVLIEEGINEVTINNTQAALSNVEISFIVDATGSMGDEIEYLKDDLESVIKRAKDNNPVIEISTSAIFYRDQGDEYLTRISGFSNNIAATLNFIRQQEANGGGDTPEAVHTGLNEMIKQLQWSDRARAKIAFLLLDAPPHYTPEIVSSLQNSIKAASKKGIKLIPVTASGIDKETEFLMRFFSITTNSTYVFITNHSGIGNDHLEPSVGDYEVEYLNDLMVRLINKYSQ